MIKLVDILLEIGDSSSEVYFWKNSYKDGDITRPGGYEEFEFTTDSDLDYGVVIENERGYLHVDFTADGGYSSTNKGELFKVMATVVDILSNILEKDKNKKIIGIAYRPSEEDSDYGLRRDKLYRAFISKKMPGTTFDQKKGTEFGPGFVFAKFPKK